MKTQLLEDIGESILPPDSPLQRTESDPGHGTRQPPAEPGSASRHPGTWRSREPAPAPPRLPPQPQLHSFDADIDPLAESWAIANPDTGPTWFERRGRRAAGWSAGLAAALLLAGGLAWMLNERKTDEALATVASVPLVTRAPIEPLEFPLLQASELALPVPELDAELPVFMPTPAPTKPVRIRRALAVKKTPSRALPPPADPAKVRAAQAAETLRQCRAAGYHARQCVQRACVATPYGIACKG